MVRVMIVDDQEMIRAGLRSILGKAQELEVIGDAADGLTALQLVRDDPVDVVLVDIRMPGIDGVETTRRLRELYPAEQVRVVILTTFDQDDNVLTAIRAGANAFLSKAAGPQEIVTAITDVMSGGGALSPAAAHLLIRRTATETTLTPDRTMAEKFATLTPRETDVVQALMAGLDVDTIAEQRFLSPFTVKTHANRAMAKVGARDRAQLVAFAYQADLHPSIS